MIVIKIVDDYRGENQSLEALWFALDIPTFSSWNYQLLNLDSDQFYIKLVFKEDHDDIFWFRIKYSHLII